MEENKVMNEETQVMETKPERDSYEMVENYDSEVVEDSANGLGALKVIGILGGVAAIGTGLYIGGKKLLKKGIRKYVEKHAEEFGDIYYEDDWYPEEGEIVNDDPAIVVETEENPED